MENLKRNIENSFVSYVLSEKESHEAISYHYKNTSIPILIDNINLRNYFSRKSTAFQVYIFDNRLQVMKGIDGSQANPELIKLLGPALNQH